MADPTIDSLVGTASFDFADDTGWSFTTSSWSPDCTITNATQADPCVLTVTTGTWWARVGDTVTISGVVGMTELNGNTYDVTAVNMQNDTVTIDVDSTGFTAYTSGGTASTNKPDGRIGTCFSETSFQLNPINWTLGRRWDDYEDTYFGNLNNDDFGVSQGTSNSPNDGGAMAIPAGSTGDSIILGGNYGMLAGLRIATFWMYVSSASIAAAEQLYWGAHFQNKEPLDQFGFMCVGLDGTTGIYTEWSYKLDAGTTTTTNTTVTTGWHKLCLWSTESTDIDARNVVTRKIYIDGVSEVNQVDAGGPTVQILDAFAENPARLTSDGSPDFAGWRTGDEGTISSIAGGTWGTNLNGNSYTITKNSDTEITLDGVDATGFGTHTSGSGQIEADEPGSQSTWKTLCWTQNDTSGKSAEADDVIHHKADLHEAGTATSPKAQPAKVSAWISRTIDEDTTGAWKGTTTYEAQYSTDGGANYGTNDPDYDDGNWETLSDANLAAVTVDEDGSDTLRVRATLTPDTTLSNKVFAPRCNNITVNFGVDQTVTPAAQALTLTLQTATIVIDDTASPDAEALVSTLNAPIHDVSNLPAVQSLALSLESATVEVAQLPSALSLTLTLESPSVDISETQEVSAFNLTLTLETPTPKVDIFPSALSVTLTLETPSVFVSDEVTPSAFNLTLTLESPSLVIDSTQTPAVQALTLTQESESSVVTHLPSEQALTFTLEADTLEVKVLPSALALALTIETPTITTGESVDVTPSALAVTLTLTSPTVEITLLPDAIGLVDEVLSPSLSIDSTQTPSAQSLTLSLVAPLIITAEEQSALNLTLTLETPSFPITSTIAVGVQSLTLSVTDPVETVRVLPSAESLALSVLSPVFVPAEEQALLSLTLSLLPVTFRLDWTTFPDAQDLNLSVTDLQNIYSFTRLRRPAYKNRMIHHFQTTKSGVYQ